MTKPMRILAIACLTLGVAGTQVAPAHASRYIPVNSCGDDSQLQTAVTLANADNANDTIAFYCSGTIPLSRTLQITGSVTIDGNGQSVAIDGGNSVQLFHDAGAALGLNQLTLQRGGDAGGDPAIYIGGSATIANSTIENNSFQAIESDSGQLTITNSALTDNSVTENSVAFTSFMGGAIFNGGTLTISNSTLSNNTIASTSCPGGYSCNDDGGAVFNGGAMTITNSTFANNVASCSGGGCSADGGAIRNAGTATITNSTLTNNSADGRGGGIRNEGTLTITSSTIAHSSAGMGGGIDTVGTLTATTSTLANNSGGGIVSESGSTLTVRSSTIASNSGGGIDNNSGTFTLVGSIVAGNTPVDCSPLNATGADYGDNLDTDGSCTFQGAPGDITTSTPGLDPQGLQSNGGPTQTIALEPGSRAIDASQACGSPDQRGVPRPDGNETNCDIGAYEFVDDTTAPTTSISLSPTSPNGTNGWYLTQPAVSLSATDPDNTSGLTTYYSVDHSSCGSPTGSTTGCTTYSAPFNLTDGVHTVYFFSVDPAGNAEVQRSRQVKVDTVPPTVTGSTDRGPDHNGWYNHALTVTWGGNDGSGSGIASCDAPTSYAGPDSLTASATGHCTDQAGNTGSGSVSFQYDATPPTITVSLDKSPAPSGWYNLSTGAPTVNFTCGDNLSGLAGSCPSPYTFPSGANQSYSQTVYDNAGNSNSAGVSGINVDLTAPSCTAAASPSSIWPPNKKMVNVTVALTTSYGASGAGSVVLQSVTTNEGNISQESSGWAPGTLSTSGQFLADRYSRGSGRVYTLTYQITNLAGNSSTCTATVTVPHNQ